MTSVQRVRSAQRVLGAGALARAAMWGIAASLVALAVIAFAALLFPAMDPGNDWLTGASIALGVTVTLALLWRVRHLRSDTRVALWFEEKIPALQYSLVTGIEYTDGREGGAIEAEVARHDIGGVARSAVARALGPALGAAIAGAALLYISPSPAFGGGSLFPRIGGFANDTAVPAGSRLEGLSVQVIPPAYARRPASSLDDPSSVAALIGSRVIVRGRGNATGITGTAGAVSLDAARSGSRGWRLSVSMPPKPVALTIRDRAYERLIVLAPLADNAPKITLQSPQRDSTLRAARLAVRLEAAASDDIGLSSGYFEYLITTGSGEVFNARTVTTPVVSFGGSSNGSLSATLDLATLKIGQGDIVSIRAITQDVNTLSGPGLATSDTRTFRIARADEYDSVSLEAAGTLPVDSSAMSQRMLIIMTEQLVREQKQLARPQLVKRSTEIGDLEDRIRKRVHEILYEQEGGEEGPAGEAGADPGPGPDTHVHAEEGAALHNADLLEAYNALWEAVRSLQIAEPEPALPPMRRALKALDRARLANRMYLRGIPPRVIVDLARVRMTGKEKGSASSRTPRSRADSIRAGLEERFSYAIELIASRPADAVRALTLLQVEALAVSPRFATAIGEAVDAFRRGRDATLPLLRARRALSGEPSGLPGLPVWTGGW